jgi:GMP synthase (glutamine-hydrolysing)
MAPPYVFESGLPVLGICYGMQLLAYQLGGRVAPGQRREYGPAMIYQADRAAPIFEGLPSPMPVWMSHGDVITEMPPRFRALAHSENS